jgi:hypothetical protein
MDVEVRIGAGAAKTVARIMRAGRTVEKIMIVINVRGCFGSCIYEDGYAKVPSGSCIVCMASGRTKMWVVLVGR